MLDYVISHHRTITRVLPGSEAEELMLVGMCLSFWGIIREKVIRVIIKYNLVFIYEMCHFPNYILVLFFNFLFYLINTVFFHQSILVYRCFADQDANMTSAFYL